MKTQVGCRERLIYFVKMAMQSGFPLVPIFCFRQEYTTWPPWRGGAHRWGSPGRVRFAPLSPSSAGSPPWIDGAATGCTVVGSSPSRPVGVQCSTWWSGWHSRCIATTHDQPIGYAHMWLSRAAWSRLIFLIWITTKELSGQCSDGMYKMHRTNRDNHASSCRTWWRGAPVSDCREPSVGVTRARWGVRIIVGRLHWNQWMDICMGTVNITQSREINTRFTSC